MDRTQKRKAFGQHFLRDTDVCEKIVTSFLKEIETSDCDSILEIGPGKGALTLLLLEKLKQSDFFSGKIKKVILIEKDFALIDMWRDFLSTQTYGERVAIIGNDFLKLNSSDWVISNHFGVLSNLPYSVGTAITLELLEKKENIRVMSLMFQAEVARRFRATNKDSEWGSLSIWTQNNWDVQRLISVSPKAFSPPPKVDSEVAIFKPRKSQRVPTPDVKLWNSLLKTAFSHRRKMLRSGLPKTGNWKTALKTAGIEETLRPEQLDWSDWFSFYNALLELHHEK